MESKANVFRRWRRVLVVIVGIWVVGLAGALGIVAYQNSVHMQWYRRVELLILQLARKQPANVSAAQWAQCLSCTWNLHMNYGPSGYFAVDSRDVFAAEFKRRLDGPVALETIDWIWDEYERSAPRAKSYDHYRPTTPEMLEKATELERRGQEPPLDAWVKMLEERERRLRWRG